jgi:hypothetical protein
MEKVRMCSFTGLSRTVKTLSFTGLSLVTVKGASEEFYCNGDCEACTYGIDQEADDYFNDCDDIAYSKSLETK